MRAWPGRAYSAHTGTIPASRPGVGDAASSVASHVLGVGAVRALAHPGVEVLDLGGLRLLDRLAARQLVFTEHALELLDPRCVECDIVLTVNDDMTKIDAQVERDAVIREPEQRLQCLVDLRRVDDVTHDQSFGTLVVVPVAPPPDRGHTSA